MKKALIAGINGQDGSYLTELLLEKGYIVNIGTGTDLSIKSLAEKIRKVVWYKENHD